MVAQAGFKLVILLPQPLESLQVAGQVQSIFIALPSTYFFSFFPLKSPVSIFIMNILKLVVVRKGKYL
jgi:hypothetical protein